MMWGYMARCANNLGLDATLFPTDFKLLTLGWLPTFYQGVFKTCFLNGKEIKSVMYWLLKGPLIHAVRLDVCSTVTGLMRL